MDLHHRLVKDHNTLLPKMWWIRSNEICMYIIQVSPRDVVASDVVGALEMCAPSVSADDLTCYSEFMGTSKFTVTS